jgi:hypothetical protein
LKLAAKKNCLGKFVNGTDLHCARLYLDSKDMKNKFIDYLKGNSICNNPENPLTLPELSMLKIGID